MVMSKDHSDDDDGKDDSGGVDGIWRVARGSRWGVGGYDPMKLG